MAKTANETIKCLNYNVVFTYAVKAVQELSEIVKKQQQKQIEEQKHKHVKLIHAF